MNTAGVGRRVHWSAEQCILQIYINIASREVCQKKNNWKEQSGKTYAILLRLLNFMCQLG